MMIDFKVAISSSVANIFAVVSSFPTSAKSMTIKQTKAAIVDDTILNPLSTLLQIIILT